MSDTISIFVPGTPTAWARTSRGMGARASGKYASFTAVNQRAAGETIKQEAWLAASKINAPMFKGPVHLSIVAVFPWPISWSAKKRKENPWKTTRPDRDNIEKLVMDSLNGVIWEDDSQVCDGPTKKVYGDPPGMFIEVRPL